MEQRQRGNKHSMLSIEEPAKILNVAKALANPVRLRILQMLSERTMNIKELAQRLSEPVSTVALGVRILEESGLISTELLPGAHGSMKISSRQIDFLSINLTMPEQEHSNMLTLNMPVGCYSKIGDLEPSCGLAGVHAGIGMDDKVLSFYTPERYGAQLLWFRRGYVEYWFSCLNLNEISIDWLELSFEACSEAPMHRDPWKSNIAIHIAEKCAGVWTSPCDCGDRRGRLNPAWWPNLTTQYGFWKTIRVDEKGSFLDGVPVSDVRISDMSLKKNAYIPIRFEVQERNGVYGGLNLFGAGFGDVEQDIVLRIGYHL